jgi:hypothetical protein
MMDPDWFSSYSEDKREQSREGPEREKTQNSSIVV